MRAVLLLNAGETIAAWQYKALKTAVDKGLNIITIAHCADRPRSRPHVRNFGYYLFALSGKRAMTTLKPMSIRSLMMPGIPELMFSSERDGVWRKIPTGVADGFGDADVVINLGMDMLGATDLLPVTHGVLRYHHGDPEQFRGSPAGYYELKQGAEVQGVVVQRLSDIPDGGEILAKSYAPVVPHSYAQTLQGAYLAGIPLLAKAIEALEAGVGHKPGSSGPAHDLPTNASVARQVVVLAGGKARHLAYGLLREKRWRVGRLAVPLNPESEVLVSSADIKPIESPPGYSFVADCFASPGGGVYCEALNSRSGKGEIGRWKPGGWAFLDLGLRGGHASYPQPLEHDESLLLLPEIADVSSPVLFRLQPDGVGVSERIELKGLEDVRLLDATLFSHDGTWYLFAGTRDSANFRLELWVAPALAGPYRLHPSSPVCMDPRGARMAGPITEIDGRLYRFGQHCTQNYGGHISVHRVEELTEGTYRESRCGSIRCGDSWGPHTVSVWGDETWIDFFSEETSLLAGVRRFKGRYLSQARARPA